MRFSTKQIKLLHVIPRKLQIDDPQRRLIQRNVGGFHSAADRTATREGLIAVMAFYEDRAGGRLPGFTEGYWQSQDKKANPTDRITWRCRKEARDLGLSAGQLDAFVAGPHMSRGAYATLADCPAYWLRKVLQALVEIHRRRNRPVNRLTG